MQNNLPHVFIAEGKHEDEINELSHEFHRLPFQSLPPTQQSVDASYSVFRREANDALRFEENEWMGGSDHTPIHSSQSFEFNFEPNYFQAAHPSYLPTPQPPPSSFVYPQTSTAYPLHLPSPPGFHMPPPPPGYSAPFYGSSLQNQPHAGGSSGVYPMLQGSGSSASESELNSSGLLRNQLGLPSSSSSNSSSSSLNSTSLSSSASNSAPNSGGTKLKQISVSSLFAAAAAGEKAIKSGFVPDVIPPSSTESFTNISTAPLITPLHQTNQATSSQRRSSALLSMLKPKTPPPPPVPEVTEALSDSEQAQLVISATTTPATREEEKEEEKQTSLEAKKSSKKSFGPTRTTFHQDCELLCFRLLATRSGRDASKDEIPLEVDASISTEQNLVIEWRIPCSRFPSHTEATLFKEKDLAMGLFRLGSPDNLRSVVSKSIAASSQRRLAVDMFGNKQFRGRLAFRSPKTAGCFVFRLFDRSTPESAVTTLGTSSRFWNVLYDGDVTNMLLRSFEGFQPRRLCSDNNTALIQLRATIEGMKNAGRRVKNVDAPALMRQCVDIMLGLVELTLPVFEEQHRRALFKSSFSGKNDVQEVDAEGTVADTDMSYDMEADKPMGSEALKGSRKDHHFEDYSLCKRLHLEVFDTLTALSNSKIAFSMLPSPQSSAVLNMQQNFCSLNYRFYSSVTDKEAAVSNLLGFAVSDYEVITDSSSLQALNESILFTIPSLLPGSSFLADREAIARSVEVIVLHNHESISSHPASKVVLFGSSRNGFGSVSSDVDMCLLLGEGNVLSAAEKQNKIEMIGAALEEAGMQKVEIRSTSRIPLVLFTHPTSGLECDLSLSNPLAINNTDLLLTYSRIDDRVRPLAFLIKQWSKARGINNPGEGTLSSYAFLLCLIHFLQTRPLPVLPYLQSLPPNWRGENNFESSLNAEMLSSTVDLQLCSSDNIACNTYFLKPNEQQFELLRSGSRRNTQTVGELLVDFFEYFAHKFDFRKDIVSIRNQQNNFTPATPESLTRFAKLVKAEEDCWQLHDRWSIEDPFETFYNVGHVVKGPQMLLIRKEFMRAYALCNRSLRRETGNSLGTICTSSEGSSILPSSVDPGDLISLLLKPAATIIP